MNPTSTKKKQASATYVAAPAAQSRRVVQRGPRLNNKNSNLGLVVENSFLYSEIRPTDTEFNVQVMTFQPGNTQDFPWLSGIASRFEKYELMKLSVRYIPSCGTDTSGQFNFYWEYDVEDANVPGDMKEASVQKNSTSCAPWVSSSMSCSIPDVNRTVREFYVTNSETNNRWNDAVKLVVSYQSSTGSVDTLWGTLWIDYRVKFHTPAFQNTGNPILREGSETFYEQPTDITIGTTTDTAVINSATTPISPRSDQLNIGPISPQTSLSVGGMVEVPPGRYIMGTTPNYSGTSTNTANTSLIYSGTTFGFSDTDNIVAAAVTDTSANTTYRPGGAGSPHLNVNDAYERVVDLPVKKFVTALADYSLSNIASVVINRASSFFLRYLGPSLLLASVKGDKLKAHTLFHKQYVASTLARHHRLGRLPPASYLQSVQRVSPELFEDIILRLKSRPSTSMPTSIPLSLSSTSSHDMQNPVTNTGAVPSEDPAKTCQGMDFTHY